jgi:uncharacterized membrane protein
MRPRAAVLVLFLLSPCACRPASDQAPAAIEPASAPAEAPRPDVPPAYLGDLDARGTEPFWALKIRKSGLALERPGAASLSAPNPGPVMEGIVAVWKSGPLGVRLRRGACSDGMSDRDYPMFAEVRAGGVTLKGCAAPAGG